MTSTFVNQIMKTDVVSIDENKLVGIITASDLVKVCIGSDSEMRKICDSLLL